MRITEITIKLDTGATLEYRDPKGLSIGDIPGLLGQLPGNQDDPTSLQGILASFISMGLGMLLKRFGLPV